MTQSINGVTILSFDELQWSTFLPTPPSADRCGEGGGLVQVPLTKKKGEQNVMLVNDILLASSIQKHSQSQCVKERTFFAFLDSGLFVTEEGVSKELFDAATRLGIDSLLVDLDLFPPQMRKQLQWQEQFKKALKPGTVNIVEVRHDTWCDFLSKKGECNCDPDMAINELSGEIK